MARNNTVNRLINPFVKRLSYFASFIPRPLRRVLSLRNKSGKSHPLPFSFPLYISVVIFFAILSIQIIIIGSSNNKNRQNYGRYLISLIRHPFPRQLYDNYLFLIIFTKPNYLPNYHNPADYPPLNHNNIYSLYLSACHHSVNAMCHNGRGKQERSLNKHSDPFPIP